MTATVRSDIHFDSAERAVLARIEALPDHEAAAAFLQLAQSYWRAGDEAKFADTFRRAYVREPASAVDRFLPDGVPTTASARRDIALALTRQGVAYSPVIGALAVAEAQLGHLAETQRLIDYDRFFHTGSCPPPEGRTRDEFHAELIAEIRSDLTYYEKIRGLALVKSWRRSYALMAQSPALSALRRLLQLEVDRYIATLPDDGSHPFVAARPAEPGLSGYALVSGSEGHHHSHIHPRAWATGVYYISRPSSAVDGKTGWLQVGPPEWLGVSTNHGWDARSVEPAAGAFVLMPGYFYHQTEPMGVDEERICIAFEVTHPELALATYAAT